MQLSPDQIARLDRLANFATRYEAVLTLPDGRKWLVAYCGRKSRAGLLAAVRERGKAILARLPAEAADGDLLWKGGRFVFTGGTTIAWSGRTQRDAICNGELPYVAE